MQDQAFLGPESGLAVPAEDGGVDLYVATQWLHVDQRPDLRARLGLPPEKVRLTLAGVGGAFGGREDLSMQVHACLLALHTGKPVKMVYNREESFFGHVHRHPARMRYEHGATRDGTLVYVRARDRARRRRLRVEHRRPSSRNAGTLRRRARTTCPNVRDRLLRRLHQQPAVRRDARLRRGAGRASPTRRRWTGSPPRSGMDPVELRMPQRACAEGDRDADRAGGRRRRRRWPSCCDGVAAMPLPPTRRRRRATCASCPAASPTPPTARASARRRLRASAIKNVGFSEGFDDYSTARVRLEVVGGEPLRRRCTPRRPRSARAWSPSQAQIARTELGVERVVVHPADTAVGSAGSTSASRQTYMTGGAVKAACEAVRERVLEPAARSAAGRTLRLDGGEVVADGAVVADLAELLGDEAVEETVEWRHRPTEPLDPETGQGDAHVQYAFSAHRAVVDVDTELGLVKVVELATAQDVGKAINPQARRGPDPGRHAPRAWAWR